MSHYYPSLRDFSTNNVNLEPYEDGEYTNVIVDINTALHSVGYCYINIFMDSSGLVFAKDSSGNDINRRLIKRTDYRYPYYDLSGVLVDGHLDMYFEDGDFIHNDDMNSSEYWYTIDGVEPVVIKQFT